MKLLTLCNNRSLVRSISRRRQGDGEVNLLEDVASAFVRLYKLCLDAGTVQYCMDDLESPR